MAEAMRDERSLKSFMVDWAQAELGGKNYAMHSGDGTLLVETFRSGVYKGQETCGFEARSDDTLRVSAHTLIVVRDSPVWMSTEDRDVFHILSAKAFSDFWQGKQVADAVDPDLPVCFRDGLEAEGMRFEVRPRRRSPLPLNIGGFAIRATLVMKQEPGMERTVISRQHISGSWLE